ncbi:MAG: hypothetical protein ACRCW2_07865 [Cellulosilyticaceae bacterium]
MEKRKRGKFIAFAVVLFFIFTETIYAKAMDPKSLSPVIQSIKEESGMTSQIKVLSVKYEEDKVTINLSKELVAYGGGTYTEYIIGAKLMEWVFTHTEANMMCLQIEGKDVLLPEGSDYSACTRENYEAYYKLP